MLAWNKSNLPFKRSPHGPLWLLEFQPLHPHSRQQKERRRKAYSTIFYLFIYYFFKQVAAPMAYGSSRARGQAIATVEATPSSYVVSHTGSPFFFFFLLFLRVSSFFAGFCFCFFFGLLSFVFLGPHPWHMGVPRPGVQSELPPLAHTRATATPDPSHVHDPHHSPWQRRIPHPLGEARDQTRNPMVPSRIHFCCATTRTAPLSFR